MTEFVRSSGWPAEKLRLESRHEAEQDALARATRVRRCLDVVPWISTEFTRPGCPFAPVLAGRRYLGTTAPDDSEMVVVIAVAINKARCRATGVPWAG